jgi:hypothetical protein
VLLYIPSHARATPENVRMGPFPRIPRELRIHTHFVVPHGQMEDYDAVLRGMNFPTFSVVETPPHVRGIGPTRHWIGLDALSRGDNKFVMMDDDIDFLVRKSPEDWRLTGQTEEDTLQMFNEMEHWLDQYASVGISSREGNNRAGVGRPRDPNMVAVATRVMRMFGCRTRDWLEMEHGRVEVMEDFDLQLQLLRAGRGNCCLFYYANGQKMTSMAGGCSTYRTHELHEASAVRLAELHPGLVRLREKANKTDREGFGTRKEVTISWKRAAGQVTDSVQ